MGVGSGSRGEKKKTYLLVVEFRMFGLDLGQLALQKQRKKKTREIFRGKERVGGGGES